MSDELSVNQIWELMASTRTCMFVEEAQEGLTARPMTAIPREEEGIVWFVSGKSRGPAVQPKDARSALLAFQDKTSGAFLSVKGDASRKDDRAKVHDLWNPMMKEFFDGPDDPRIELIAFHPHQADYWNGPGVVMSTLKMLFTAATGEKTDMGARGKVAL